MIPLQQFKSKFLQLWQIELVRCYERDQSPALQPPYSPNTQQPPQSIHVQLHERALHFLEHYQLYDSLNNTIKSLKVMVFLLFALALVVGFGLAKVVDGNVSRVLSLPWVLFALLGVHLLLYFIWLAMLFIKPRQGGFIGGFIQQGLQLFNRTPKAKYALQSLGHTLNHYQMVKLVVSIFSHLYWLVLLTTAALILGLLFLFQSYSFTWETTVLNLPTMTYLAELLGRSLSWLGLSLPTVEVLQTASAEQQAQVGRWLIGMVLVYGSGLRLVTALLVAGVLTVRSKGLTVDHTQPGLSHLVPLLLRSGTQSVDKENPVIGYNQQAQQPASGVGHYWLQLEHPEAVEQQLTANHKTLGTLATMSDLERLTAQFKTQPAASMLVTIDNQLTPDRGNMRLLRGLLPLAAELHCHLVHEQGAFTEGWLSVLQGFNSEHNFGQSMRISQAEHTNDN